MCGIFGRVNRNTAIDEGLFLRQLNRVYSRGPDSSGTFFSGNIALGHRRLSIIDLSENGNQPMFNEDGSVAIIFNGEIYNYKQVISNLKKSHNFKSRSDTEALIHGYEELGTELTKHIEGLFAFCLYDTKNSHFFLARDHFGKKPLYYYLDEDTFMFGSELKTIIEDASIKKRLVLDKPSVEKFLYYGYIPSPHAIFKNIYKLEPASQLVFNIKSWSLEKSVRYWHPENISVVDREELDILSDVETFLDSAVEKRLMSDVPLGIFLSGGVDSSLVAHYLADKTSNLTSYTIAYPEYKDIDESEYASYVAKKCGFKYRLINFKSENVLSSFKAIYDYLDEPLADAAIVPLYYMSKYSRRDMTVVLSGDGGDEVFSGYPKYSVQNIIEKYKWMGFATELLGKFVPDSIQFKKAFKLFNSDFEVRQFIFGSGAPCKEDGERILGHEIDEKRVFEESYKYSQEFKQNDIINKSNYLDWKLQLPDWYLVKSDRGTMANSQEMRSPLMDKDLAEYMLSVPGKIKMKNGQSKYILKKLLSRHYPSAFVNRKKRGFGVPLDKWMRGELRDLFEYYVSIENGVFDSAVSKRLLKEHLSCQRDHRFQLLRIFSFNYFYKNVYGSSN